MMWGMSHFFYSRRPPVLLVHGEADEVVPAMASRQAARALQAEAVPHELLLRPDLGYCQLS